MPRLGLSADETADQLEEAACFEDPPGCRAVFPFTRLETDLLLEAVCHLRRCARIDSSFIPDRDDRDAGLFATVVVACLVGAFLGFVIGWLSGRC